MGIRSNGILFSMGHLDAIYAQMCVLKVRKVSILKDISDYKTNLEWKGLLHNSCMFLFVLTWTNHSFYSISLNFGLIYCILHEI